jgi:LmbE family N-acetylglucosaminyl deacetylase
MTNILIVAPHPDDETLGCASVIANRSRAGDDVHIVVLTDGHRLFISALGIHDNPSPQEVSDRRKRETERAVGILGGNAANIRYLDYKDGSLEAHSAEVVRRLLPIFEELRPAEVYVTNAYEHHPDHRAASTIVSQAIDTNGLATELFQYFIGPKAGYAIDPAREQVIEVDISRIFELKKVAVNQFECHLKVISPKQTKPLWENGNAYLHQVEKFIVRRPEPKE